MAKSIGQNPTPMQQSHSGQLQDLKSQQKGKESELKKQGGSDSKVDSKDAARLASQAGFQRTKKKSKKGFDVGDGSEQQFALPDDELDTELWSQERLDNAQQNMTLAGAQMGSVARGEGDAGVPMAATLVGSAFNPTEEDLADMEDLSERAPPKIPNLDDLMGSMSSHFGIELGDDVPIGHRLLAAGLLVAGERDAIKRDDNGLEEKTLAGGVETVTKRGNQAVGDAQRMSKGVNREISLQRTMVFRR